MKPTLNEIYSTLNSLVDAYTQVMATFASVVEDVQAIRAEVADLREMMKKETADAITAAELWRSVAEAHRLEAEKLREQIYKLQEECDDGRR